MEKDQEIIRTSLRLPKRLYDKIAVIAEERGLTMHAEIISMLNNAVEMTPDIPSQINEPEGKISATQLINALEKLQENINKFNHEIQKQISKNK